MGIVILKDGSRRAADLVIAADGIHSKAVKFVTGSDNPAVDTGLSIFRWLAPSSDLLEDPEINVLMGDDEGINTHFVERSDKRLVYYPCRK